MNVGTIEESIRSWQQNPEKAKGKPVVNATSDGSQAVLEAGPFSWRADLPQALGGGNLAPSPTALLLGALAGCAVAFIRDTLAPQLGVAVTSVRASARCTSDARGLVGLPGAVPDLQDVELQIEIASSDSQDKVERLYRTWEARCPVYLALTKAVPVKTHLEVKAQ